MTGNSLKYWPTLQFLRGLAPPLFLPLPSAVVRLSNQWRAAICAHRSIRIASISDETSPSEWVSRRSDRSTLATLFFSVWVCASSLDLFLFFSYHFSFFLPLLREPRRTCSQSRRDKELRRASNFQAWTGWPSFRPSGSINDANQSANEWMDLSVSIAHQVRQKDAYGRDRTNGTGREHVGLESIKGKKRGYST